jgi:hypothetical protein
MFLDETTEKALEKRPPLPVQDYTAVIEKIDAREWVGKTDPSKSGVALDIKLRIDIPADVQDQLGFDQPTLLLNDSVMIDIVPGGKGIDWSKGKNNQLRKYREATGTNVAGQPFSPRMLEGKVVRVKIGHREYQGAPVEEVAGVAGA